MEAIGQLTGGIAHDFNNLLTVILGGADIAERLVGEREAQAHSRQYASCGEARENLTRQLLTFSRRQALKPVNLDVAQQLTALWTPVAFIARATSHRHRVPTICPRQIVGELELALLNVGLNARDAMPHGGTLTIARANMAARPGKGTSYVVIDLIDTGIGMSERFRRALSRSSPPRISAGQRPGPEPGLRLCQAVWRHADARQRRRQGHQGQPAPAGSAGHRQ